MTWCQENSLALCPMIWPSLMCWVWRPSQRHTPASPGRPERCWVDWPLVATPQCFSLSSLDMLEEVTNDLEQAATICRKRLVQNFISAVQMVILRKQDPYWQTISWTCWKRITQEIKMWACVSLRTRQSRMGESHKVSSCQGEWNGCWTKWWWYWWGPV